MKITSRQSILRVLIVLAIIAVVIVISVKTEKAKQLNLPATAVDTVALFNGHDLQNWHIVLKDSLAPADSTFFVKDGMIYCTGKPFGYIRTTDKFTDFNLHVEWRWPGDAGNSGVFLFVNQDKVFPDCLECQLFHDHAGDFIAMGKTDFTQRSDKTNKVVDKMRESSENPTGEWNIYDIRVQGDSVSVYVNGVLQNVASGLNRSGGWIALQSEGAPIEFRNVTLIKKD
ncbi:MAG TPA: DUF1080 domain-containing protein [Bacteroidales bacterium]|nr:DUF1080 domain-containing protein [Bacteroidales bacterium]